MRLAGEQNKYTFAVALAADKVSAAKELEAVFGVKVVSANTSTRLGKPYGYGKYRNIMRRKPAQKVMVFTLAEGNKIDLFTVK